MTDRLDAAIRELVEAFREAARAEAEARPRAPDRLLSIPEAAEALAIGRSALYAEIGAGRLRTVKVGRRRLVPASAITERISARPPSSRPASSLRAPSSQKRTRLPNPRQSPRCDR